MGLFSKIKEKFSSNKEVNKVDKKETEIYEKGLEKKIGRAHV